MVSLPPSRGPLFAALPDSSCHWNDNDIKESSWPLDKVSCFSINSRTFTNNHQIAWNNSATLTTIRLSTLHTVSKQQQDTAQYLPTYHTMSAPSNKTVFFLGASGGVGLAALKHTLTAGHKCIALCRTPSKLTDILPADQNPNLKVVQGNAHDVVAVASGLKKDDGSIVDEIVTTIGSRPSLAKLGGIEDPEVCRNGMTSLLEALAQVQKEGATGKPLIVACSTTGISRFGRDIPLAMIPLYHFMLKVPHEDKRIMEEKLVESGVDFTIVRPSLLTDGASDTAIRVGLEDPKTGRESDAVGYTISREDAGRWLAENLLVSRDAKYVNKVASITY